MANSTFTSEGWTHAHIQSAKSYMKVFSILLVSLSLIHYFPSSLIHLIIINSFSSPFLSYIKPIRNYQVDIFSSGLNVYFVFHSYHLNTPKKPIVNALATLHWLESESMNSSFCGDLKYVVYIYISSFPTHFQPTYNLK